LILKRINLINFRNYSSRELFFNNRFNFIYGKNGEGKTNILEAVSITTSGKSFLGSSEQDCLKFNKDNFTIETDFENELGNNFKINVAYDSSIRKKSFTLNNERVKSFSSEVFGRFPIVFFSPGSLNITYGNPSERRKFFDILIAQTNKVYLENLKELNKLTRQKNALMKGYTLQKKFSFKETDDLLKAYNEKIIDFAFEVVSRRASFLREFSGYFSKNFGDLRKTEEPAINYYSEIFGEIDTELLNIGILEKYRSSLAEQLEKIKDEEISKCICLAGPHRDDYVFRLRKDGGREGFELRNFASQGEHKTFIIALKLSEYDYLKEKTGTNPALLLDDLLSELDEDRVSTIISHLKDFGQIFLTTTDINYLEKLRNFFREDEISIYNITNGLN